LELERERYIDTQKIENEIRYNENKEKRNILIQIENYYRDKISMLKDILRREKYEKELEYREQIKFLSKLERERKLKFKKDVNYMFDRLEEEDKKNEIRNLGTDKIEKILYNYYKDE
jgi:hypothetical protein